MIHLLLHVVALTGTVLLLAKLLPGVRITSTRSAVVVALVFAIIGSLIGALIGGTLIILGILEGFAGYSLPDDLLSGTGLRIISAILLSVPVIGTWAHFAVFNGDYHGISDELLVAGVAGPDGERKTVPVAPGIPESLVQNVLVVDYEDPNCIDILRANADRLAAVIVEPVPSRRPDFQPREVIARVRELTAEKGIALIFDEMLTGFRLHPRGAQGYYGIDADIVAYGKILSGGLPMAAVAGKAEYLDAFDGGAWRFGDDSFPERRVTFFGGTFVRHPVSMAASIAVLDRLREEGPGLQEGISARAEELTDRLNGLFGRTGAPMRLSRAGSMLHLGFQDESPLCRLILSTLHHHGRESPGGYQSFCCRRPCRLQ